MGDRDARGPFTEVESGDTFVHDATRPNSNEITDAGYLLWSICEKGIRILFEGASESSWTTNNCLDVNVSEGCLSHGCQMVPEST